jgi:hypothetical protein
MKNVFKILTVLAFAFTATAQAFAGTVTWANPNTYGPINHVSGTSIVQSTNYNSSTYMNTSSASAGDRVAVLVYFHNAGNADATNTMIHLDNPTGSSTSFTLSGSVQSGSASKQGSTTINLSSSQTLTYIPGSLRIGFDRDPNGIAVSNDTDIFSGAGLNIGTIQRMDSCGTVDVLCHQGWVAVGFQVSNTQTQQLCTDPNATNQGQPLPCQYNNQQICRDPAAINYNQYGACQYQQQICRDPLASNYGSYGSCQYYNNLTVVTDQPTWINQNTGSITLNGHYNNNTQGAANMYFEYRQNGSNLRAVQAGTSYDNSRSFNVSLYNLSSGYYDYRACVNGAICGQWLPFQVYQNNYPQNNTSTVQTLPAIGIGSNSAVLDGYLTLNGCSSATTYFEYGVGGSFTNTTNLITRTSSGSIAFGVDGLSPNTNYSFRAVANACGSTLRGNPLTFTTLGQSTNNNNNSTIITRTIINSTNIGGGAQFLRLTIDNGRDTIVRGDELIYVVTWENVSKKDLQKLVLEVTMPQGLQVVYADRGQIDRKANAVYVNIAELKAGEKDDMTIRARVNGSFKDNDPITARAIMAFENPINKAQENAIAYDSDTYLSNSSVLGASIFGLDFLPGSLAGWLLLILILLLIVLIIRYALRREQHHHYYTDPVVPPNTTTTTTVSTSSPDDYTPYRPTPKQ